MIRSTRLIACLRELRTAHHEKDRNLPELNRLSTYLILRTGFTFAFVFNIAHTGWNFQQKDFPGISLYNMYIGVYFFSFTYIYIYKYIRIRIMVLFLFK